MKKSNQKLLGILRDSKMPTISPMQQELLNQERTAPADARLAPISPSQLNMTNTARKERTKRINSLNKNTGYNSVHNLIIEGDRPFVHQVINEHYMNNLRQRNDANAAGVQLPSNSQSNNASMIMDSNGKPRVAKRNGSMESQGSLASGLSDVNKGSPMADAAIRQKFRRGKANTNPLNEDLQISGQ